MIKNMIKNIRSASITSSLNHTNYKWKWNCFQIIQFSWSDPPKKIFWGSRTGYLAVGPIFSQFLGGSYCLGGPYCLRGPPFPPWGKGADPSARFHENNSLLSWNSHVNTVFLRQILYGKTIGRFFLTFFCQISASNVKVQYILKIFRSFWEVGKNRLWKWIKISSW